ncbi:peptidylprolyl isomerase [Deinococcus hohokamensis]|uniref:Peptidyl-prolyl cis-trans isomerase n=1 Tax=Deinococcus hohokamensis TaxID=309883 RepID=A0ABV9I8Z5_9DEIO
MKHAALLLTALLALSACQKKEQTTQTETKTETTESTETKAAESKPTAAAVTAPAALPAGYTLVPFTGSKPVRDFKAEPAMSLEDGKDYYAVIDTTRGQIVADLYEQETPVTVNNFVTLARNHFFDGIRFHRVIEGFMAQTGDPKSVDETKKAEWGTGGPGYQFADEFRTKLTFDSPGILAMANSGPATNGSQFFITFAPTDFLNGKHTIFGKVVQGDDVLPKLTRTMNESNEEIAGATADKILSVRIVTKG